MPKARLFFLQSSIAGCQSCQGSLCLLPKIFLPDTSRSVFSVSSLSGLPVNLVGRKIIKNLSIESIRGKNKKQT
ncbi:nitrate ABC transporter permease [Phocaeicola dorei]|uniref:Nitrate ABC transporter permease n=1 Tax=Phocaeicola dorei TaxID=357276 RepID=A0A5M5ZP07_9BACT|nr:nitrate ABC transporter permease [Phocaeicola dorei]